MMRVHCQLMICRGHIRGSKGALKIFLWLMVVCENWHLSQILHFVFISAVILKGRKPVRKWKIFSGLNLNMVYWDPVQKQEKFLFKGPHHLHVIPIIPTSSPHGPHTPMAVVSMLSPWSPPHMVPTSPWSLWSPHHPHHPHIIPTSSRRSLHHPYTPTYPLHPPLHPCGVGGPESV